MKIPILILILFCSIGLYAQNSDSIGIDDFSILNKYEVELLNSLLEEQRGTFDFENKKVAFITGSSGGMIVPKSKYFKDSVIPWIKKDSSPQIFMICLTDEEKLKSNGYDVLVLSWVKLFTDKRKKKTIETLGTIK